MRYSTAGGASPAPVTNFGGEQGAKRYFRNGLKDFGGPQLNHLNTPSVLSKGVLEVCLSGNRKTLDRVVLWGALLALPLLAYGLLVLSNGKKRARLRPQPGQEVRLFSPRPSSPRAVAALADAETLERQDGELRLKWDALRERPLHLETVVESMAARWEHVTDFKVEIQPSGPDPAKLRWSPVPVSGVRYLVEIAADKTFRRKVSRYPVTEPEFLAQEPPGTYYWRVSAAKGGESVASAIGRFTLIPTHAVARKSGR